MHGPGGVTSRTQHRRATFCVSHPSGSAHSASQFFARGPMPTTATSTLSVRPRRGATSIDLALSRNPNAQNLWTSFQHCLLNSALFYVLRLTGATLASAIPMRDRTCAVVLRHCATPHSPVSAADWATAVRVRNPICPPPVGYARSYGRSWHPHTPAATTRSTRIMPRCRNPSCCCAVGCHLPSCRCSSNALYRDRIIASEARR